MSVKDLITRWEKAVALALSQADAEEGIDSQDADLEAVADQRVRSDVRAGCDVGASGGCDMTTETCASGGTWTCSLHTC